MKYVSSSSLKSVFTSGALALIIVLGGCAGAPTKTKNAGEKESKPELVATKEYLPMRQYDKEGNIVPFLPAVNPYLEIKGKINKDAVTNFIAARKALKSKNFAHSEALLKQVIAEDKSLSGPWLLLGSISEQNGNKKEAIKNYQKAIETNRLNVNAYIPLAKLLREQGDFIAAQNMYAQALSIWKDFPEAHLNLAILYDIYLNDPLQAQQHMEAYQFLKGEDDKTVASWLAEIRQRTGIEPNLYIGPPNTSQISKPEEAKSDS